jgi:hypothetical protein
MVSVPLFDLVIDSLMLGRRRHDELRFGSLRLRARIG